VPACLHVHLSVQPALQEATQISNLCKAVNVESRNVCMMKLLKK
jgi:hypothetical protein